MFIRWPFKIEETILNCKMLHLTFFPTLLYSQLRKEYLPSSLNSFTEFLSASEDVILYKKLLEDDTLKLTGSLFILIMFLKKEKETHKEINKIYKKLLIVYKENPKEYTKNC